jgi:hypothetical protein
MIKRLTSAAAANHEVIIKISRPSAAFDLLCCRNRVNCCRWLGSSQHLVAFPMALRQIYR